MMSAIQHAFTVLAARILAVLTGATLEYEVYTRSRQRVTGGITRGRSAGLYSGNRAECEHHIEDEIRSYHKVSYDYGVRPTGQLILRDSTQPASIPNQKD